MNGFGAGVAITGCGSATPEQFLSNEELSQIVETSDEWIKSRTGIGKRHLADRSVSLSQLASQAAIKALEMAQVSPRDIDLILLATSTPDDLFGSAAQVQSQIKANRAIAFDLTAACSGFLVALVTATQFIRTGTYRNVLVIGADVLSRWVDWNDRATCVLFGDGAGAVVCQANDTKDNILGFELHSDGSQNSSLNLAYEGEELPLKEGVRVQKGAYKPLKMNGREVYRFAVAKVPEVIEKALYRANLTTSDIDWLVLHQANQRIMDAVSDRLKLPPEKVISNLSEYGNTSSASIPLALDEAVRSGKVKKGDIIASSGFGAGLTWGGIIFRWGD
ncbi:MAG: beta-ketoacyl-ACP synthase III [Microcystis panniformis Mp_MB_F_20051200_S9]|uniref:Beta-ketoacyl-[acyl-carrier-protein] synthase III n=1 Tax=Microcystis panniformis Mp_MB_F_20051200_S9 TaxID=2486223 RepID=A0A552QAP7_9CHRO|nr:MAG: beta-ketoacyl-ACP synthase III [Microcystis panniformis Mp_MB_F_20080800_S26D]TRV51037.1 MAG: beta-ketoacyl-ACP synthase III [Microcystis panniformis Mp_GB_SS_20050300_S99D]TRV52080.1 MAG: beta-ketoacyl-ACP synthase III [Microcystis panniformis Mp_GB_SS_20050300_S99]TRV59844.1 MAG: beta-ketoacyl-ACP synthase III [Microcystis panniformis Mp_MB_F_20080800_S26]TRV65724.1 MAG: beta-ketoacyl-ACP synthase III [Microcystis panniformis Mp_MB_F_20051200_S9D]TRV66280.1 MAG: beta-ketoacyl-ACP syn